ncbi:PAS domain-containing sensor histidine kinase [Leptospira yasudae]|uniref:PAS domain-containing sensor histidine kinase n=1 Tax=Leptospira yasudae TaxID=2202201 RepID=UPI001091238F|nr:PAS domain-containing sensor histidine kinase [Leptospira yasudae]TGM97994.1 two-component sensor histidine kinase [Leptospira yasudae]
MELIQEALDHIGDKIRFVEFVPCPVLLSHVKGDQFQTLYLNKSFREHIGYKIQEIPTLQDWFQQAYPDDIYRKQIEDEWWSEVDFGRKSGKHNASMKAKIRTKNNGERWFHVRSTEFGELNAVAFQDIHDLETLNLELSHNNSTKTQLLSILAHDLRTPLIQIISLISLFKNEGISASELYPYLSKLNIQTYLTIDLIDNTLNWVKANSRSIVVNKTSFSPIPILEELSALYNDYIQLKCIQVEMQFDQEIALFSDKDIFKVIVRNLFVNALKFSKPGGKIYLKAEKTPDQKQLICVEDEGIGMTSEELERVFSKESYTCPGTLNENGAGLGIKLCRDFAKLAGTELLLKSKKHKGTCASMLFF